MAAVDRTEEAIGRAMLRLKQLHDIEDQFPDLEPEKREELRQEKQALCGYILGAFLESGEREMSIDLEKARVC